jgi:hypothetical protein
MMKTRLYHKAVFWPRGKFAGLQGRVLALRYTAHATAAALNDRYGVIQLPDSVMFDERNAVEMECVGKAVTKVVVRQPYDNEHDIVLAMIPTGPEFTVKTVWLNRRDDQHFTLNRNAYERR